MRTAFRRNAHTIFHAFAVHRYFQFSSFVVNIALNQVHELLISYRSTHHSSGKQTWGYIAISNKESITKCISVIYTFFHRFYYMSVRFKSFIVPF